MKNNFEVNVPGKFGSKEEAVLEYLYGHPADTIGTAGLAKILEPKQDAVEVVDETQYEIETLGAARLVKGKRVSESGKVRFVGLRLTTRGEAEAIKQQRRTKSIKVSIRMIGSEPAGSDGEA